MAEQTATGQAVARIEHADRVRALFDGKAAGWSGKYAHHGHLRGRLSQFATAIGDHVGATGRVLDLGCGTGELARYLATSGHQVIGCDIAPQMLSYAAAAAADTTVGWVQLDPRWRTLPVGPASVDAVVVASVLEYVQQPSAVLGECARVLRPGGVILCTVPNPAHPARWLEWLVGHIARTSFGRAAFSALPRLRQYLSYLQISRQRHPASWWCAVAGQAGLLPIAYLAKRSPLRLLAFRRPENSMEVQ